MSRNGLIEYRGSKSNCHVLFTANEDGLRRFPSVSLKMCPAAHDRAVVLSWPYCANAMRAPPQSKRNSRLCSELRA